MGQSTFGAARRAPAETGIKRSGEISRVWLLQRAALLGGTALVAGGVATALPDRASSAPSEAQDVRILNYVLRLERLKAAFYDAAVAGNALTGELRQLAELLSRHERVHVALLSKRLGTEAHAERVYDFGDATQDPDTFARTARTLEETAVAGYIGQGANLTRRLMVPFAQLCSVEARHAAWLGDLLAEDPAPRAADEAKPPAEVLAVIEEMGFEG